MSETSSPKKLMPLGQNPVSDRIDWPTPPEVFAPLHAEFGFTLDAAASPENAKCPRYFTADDDALAQDWGTETVWLNPPYGRLIGPFLRKAWLASKYGATVVCLIPSRTDTDWWHRYVEPYAEVRFVRGRVRFEGATAPAPFPSAIVVFRPPDRRPDVLALEAACEQCHRIIASPTTGIISGDCLSCGGRMVATKGAWTRTNFPEEG